MNGPENLPSISRRSFFRKAGLLGGAALYLPASLAADPYAPLKPTVRPRNPIRVRGRVQSGSSGVAGVSVTDGIQVVKTGPDGTYELLSDGRRPFIYFTQPAGYHIPQNESGTARFYQRITPDRDGEAEAVFNLERRSTTDANHAFFLLADPQTQDAYEVGLFHEETVPDVQDAVRSLGDRPMLGIGCGDIMFDNLELFPDYERAVKRMGIPFYQVVGNHDIVFDVATTEESYEVFSGHFGPDYYSFNMGEVHYVVLNDIFWHGAGYLGYLTADQLEWLRADLSHVEPGRTVIVSHHIPALGTRFRRRGESSPSISGSITNREALYRLLEPYDAHLLSGHTHESEHVFEGGVHEHVHGTVCGAWWSGPICYDGTPGGYAVYEVNGSSVQWRYRSVGKDFSHQMRVYPAGADRDHPDDVLANIWDWDPEWKVFWYEDGERKGEMIQRTGFDPLSVELHEGPDKPPRRTWVQPQPTDHLFYAPASPGAREITIEAIDRFGRSYTERVA